MLCIMLEGFCIGADAAGGEKRVEEAQPEALVPVVGVQLHRVLPGAVLRSHLVEHSLPGH